MANIVFGFGIALLVLVIVLALVAFTPLNKSGIRPKKSKSEIEKKKSTNNASTWYWL